MPARGGGEAEEEAEAEAEVFCAGALIELLLFVVLSCPLLERNVSKLTLRLSAYRPVNETSATMSTTANTLNSGGERHANVDPTH